MSRVGRLVQPDGTQPADLRFSLGSAGVGGVHAEALPAASNPSPTAAYVANDFRVSRGSRLGSVTREEFSVKEDAMISRYRRGVLDQKFPVVT